MPINVRSELIIIAAITRIQVLIGHLAIYASQKATLSLSTIRGNCCTLVNHYTVCIDTDWINTNCINTACLYTNCINAHWITMDCINANHVDTYNWDTIFGNTLNHAYKYAWVMSSLDFDNVESNKCSRAIPGSILAGLFLAPMAYEKSCWRGLATAQLTQNFLWRRIKGY